MGNKVITDRTGAIVTSCDRDFFDMTKGKYLVDAIVIASNYMALPNYTPDRYLTVPNSEFDCIDDGMESISLWGRYAFIYELLKKEGIPFMMGINRSSLVYLSGDIISSSVGIALNSHDDIDRLYHAIYCELSEMPGLMYVKNDGRSLHCTDKRLSNIAMGSAIKGELNSLPAIITRVIKFSISSPRQGMLMVEDLWNMVTSVTQDKYDLYLLVDGTHIPVVFNSLDEWLNSGVYFDEWTTVYVGIRLDSARQSIDEMNALIATLRLLGVFHKVKNPYKDRLSPLLLQLEL